MALRTANRLEVGQRVGWLRKQANLTHREAAELLGIDDSGLFGRIEKHGRSFDYERLAKIADAFAGRETLVDDSRELFDFIVFHGEIARVLRPHLRLVRAEPADSDATGTSDEKLTIPGRFNPLLIVPRMKSTEDVAA